jgi:hypothetical protein
LGRLSGCRGGDVGWDHVSFVVRSLCRSRLCLQAHHCREAGSASPDFMDSSADSEGSG